MTEEKDQEVTPTHVSSTTEAVEEQATQGEVIESDTQTVDELTALRSKLEEAESKAAEYLDGWQRSRAEFINFKRRQEQMQQTLRQQVTAELLEKFLAALDDYERAFAAIPAQFGEHEWVKGLMLADKKFRSLLEREGMSVMQVKPGDSFNPYYHQALLHEPSETYDEGQIVQVLQSGYLLGDTVVRPAIVCVSSGKSKQNDTVHD